MSQTHPPVRKLLWLFPGIRFRREHPRATCAISEFSGLHLVQRKSMKSPPELRSTGYRFKLEDYAKIYQVSRQTVARWANNMYGGYPLDDPKQTHLYVLMQERQPDNR